LASRCLDEANYHLSQPAEVAFRDEVARQMEQPGFANARSVRNDLDRARLRHAHRLAVDTGRQWTRDDLMRLEPDDILEDSLQNGHGAFVGPAGRHAVRSSER
jgi:hypothetical protein